MEALNGPQDFLKGWVAAFRARRDAVVAALNATPGLSCTTPQGAFYVFPSCKGVLGKKTPAGKVLNDSYAFCEYLLDEALVAVVAGAAFGLDGYFRISYATSDALLAEACKRIKDACGKLR